MSDDPYAERDRLREALRKIRHEAVDAPHARRIAADALAEDETERLRDRAERAEAERDKYRAMLGRCDEAREMVIAERDRLREAIRQHRERTQGDPYWTLRNWMPADEALWAALDGEGDGS